MLQLDSLGGRAISDYDNAVVNVNHNKAETFIPAPVQTGEEIRRPPPPHEFQQRTAVFAPEHGVGAMVHWKTGQPTQQHKQQPAVNGINRSEDDDDDDEYRPFTPPPPRERLSYTRHQLEMLNGIYQEVRYPNSTQKQLIAKRIGITREQVKIWFQNRRRKDVVTKVAKCKGPSKEDTRCSENSSPIPSPDNNGNDTRKEGMKDANNSSRGQLDQTRSYESDVMSDTSSLSSADYNIVRGGSHTSHHGVNSAGSFNSNNKPQDTCSTSTLPATSTSAAPPVTASSLVSPTILRGMIAELNKFDNEYLKLKKSKKKKHKLKSSRHVHATTSSVISCKSERLFQKYDMVAPPNKVTPTAFLNTSANKFKHAVGTSAFQNPRENRLPATSHDSRLWDGFSLNSTVPGIADNPDFIQQKPSSDHVHPSYTSTLNFSAPPNQAQFSNFLSGRDRISLSHSSLPTTHSYLHENLPVLSDLLGNYASHSSSATALAAAAAAVAAAQRQQEHSILSCVSSGQVQPPGASLSGVYFHLPGESNNCSNTGSVSGDSSKSLTSDLFSRSSTLSNHPHHQASTLTMNRVFPFPLVADPPAVLSSRQSDSFLHQPQWPRPTPPVSSQTSAQSSAQGIHGDSSTSPASLTKDQLRPLMISSLANPYFPTPTSTYPLTSTSLSSQPPLWNMQPQTENSFTQPQL